VKKKIESPMGIRTTLQSLWQFVVANKGPVALIYALTWVLYAPIITNFNYSIDSEVLVSKPHHLLYSWLGIGCFGLVALKKLAMVGLTMNPYFTNTMAVLFLASAGVLVFYLLAALPKMGRWLKLLLVGVFVASPVHVEQVAFTLQAAQFFFAVACLTLAVVLVGQPNRKTSWPALALAAVALVVSFSVYPSLATGYVALAILVNQVAALAHATMRLSVWFKAYLKYILVFGVGVLGYKLLDQLAMHMLGVQADDYVTKGIVWGKLPLAQIWQAITTQFSQHYLALQAPFALAWLTYLLGLSVGLWLLAAVRQRRLRLPLLLNTLSAYLVSLALLVVMGTSIGPVRSMTPTVPVVLVTLLMTSMALLNWRRAQPLIGVVVAALLVFLGKNTMDLEQTEILTYQAADRTADLLVQKVAERGITDYGHYTLSVVGGKLFASPLTTMGDVVGHSFWDWDSSSPVKSTGRITGFLRSKGYPFQESSAATYQQALQTATHMGVFPAASGLRIQGHHIIVKLSQ
jgi:hypothetical protein